MEEAGLTLHQRLTPTAVILHDPTKPTGAFELYLLHDHFAGHAIEMPDDGKAYEFIQSSDSPEALVQ